MSSTKEKPVSQMDIAVVTGTRKDVLRTGWVFTASPPPGVTLQLVDVEEEKGWFSKGALFLSLGFEKPHETISWQDDKGELSSNLEIALTSLDPDCVILANSSKTSWVASYTAVSMDIPTVSLYAGVRTYDPSSSREVARQVSDALSSLALPFTMTSADLLQAEGKEEEEIGEVTWPVRLLTAEILNHATQKSEILEELELEDEDFQVVDLSFPEEDGSTFVSLVNRIVGDFRGTSVVPVDPGGWSKILRDDKYEEISSDPGILLTEALDLVDSISLAEKAQRMVTDGLESLEIATELGCSTRWVGTENLGLGDVRAGAGQPAETDRSGQESDADTDSVMEKLWETLKRASSVRPDPPPAPIEDPLVHAKLPSVAEPERVSRSFSCEVVSPPQSVRGALGDSVIVRGHLSDLQELMSKW